MKFSEVFLWMQKMNINITKPSLKVLFAENGWSVSEFFDRDQIFHIV